VTPSLLSKPAQMLTKSELTTWRNNLIGKMKPASINRVCKSFRAALNLAANNDSRIKNRDAWKLGLKGLPGAEEDRNVILQDEEVGRMVLATYDHDDALGLFVHVLAETGARPSQVARLLVGDLVMINAKAPRLMMPKSAKGSGNRLARKVERYSVAITPDLAQRLKLASKGRFSRDRLLLQSNGRPWGEQPSSAYRRDMLEVIASVGFGPEVTIYALRHSSIVRQLLNNVPVRLVAASHNTSVVEIERTYSKHITDHSDEISRRAMLHLPATGAAAENVVALR
jgi:integrase